MTEAEWLSSSDPAAMLTHLRRGWHGYVETESGPNRPALLSDRKLRLFACACMAMTSTGDNSVTMALYRGAAESGAVPDDILPCSAIEQAMAWCNGTPEPPTKADAAALLREIFGNPYQACPLRDCPECDKEQWKTPSVLAIAQTIYDERAFGRMPILADAIEEAGCREEAILRHLRQSLTLTKACPECGKPGRYCRLCHGTCWMEYEANPHVRGCWAIDLILGKE